MGTLKPLELQNLYLITRYSLVLLFKTGSYSTVEETVSVFYALQTRYLNEEEMTNLKCIPEYLSA